MWHQRPKTEGRDCCYLDPQGERNVWKWWVKSWSPSIFRRRVFSAEKNWKGNATARWALNLTGCGWIQLCKIGRKMNKKSIDLYRHNQVRELSEIWDVNHRTEFIWIQQEEINLLEEWRSLVLSIYLQGVTKAKRLLSASSQKRTKSMSSIGVVLMLFWWWRL